MFSLNFGDLCLNLGEIKVLSILECNEWCFINVDDDEKYLFSMFCFIKSRVGWLGLFVFIIFFFGKKNLEFV